MFFTVVSEECYRYVMICRYAMYQQLTSVEQVTGSNSVCTPAFTIINSIARIRIIYCHNLNPSPKPVPKSNSKGLGLGVTLFYSAEPGFVL